MRVMMRVMIIIKMENTATIKVIIIIQIIIINVGEMDMASVYAMTKIDVLENIKKSKN